ncbi:MAG TPA: PQQ-binding-like beta-propeller repeat protein [Pirellulales bacterium]|nr:PQQ-binding-like beta-propeller repeat protein [Pirellulales bacterium]
MSRTAWAALGFSILLGGAQPARAQSVRGGIIPVQTARRQGLERAWAVQVEIDRARGRVAHIALHDGLLVVQSDQAALHALDAETRRTLWVGHIGSPGHPTTRPAISDQFVAATNGGDLYLFERATGRVLWKKYLESVPSAGPALGAERVYVPMVNGVVASYRLPVRSDRGTPTEQLAKDWPLRYRGNGMADAAPIVTHSSVAWGTAAGNVYACTTDTLVALYRFRTHDAISAPLCYSPPYIYAASRDGYLYALGEARGNTRWQFSTGNPIVERPVAVGDALFVITETGGMFRLNADTGAQEWFVPGVFHFVSASPTRLYTVDSSGRLLILDALSGARVGALATEHLPLKVLNIETDRIYLATTSGMIQCLHELALNEPFVHGAVGPPLDAVEEPAEGGEDKAKDEKAMPAADPNDPFGDEKPKKADDAEMPADGEEEKMAEEGAGEQ